jgi:general secretion pathway protein D
LKISIGYAVKPVDMSKTDAAPQNSKPSITVEMRNMDVIEAIKMVCSKGNINVVISKNVSGRVTLFLADVKVSDALMIILEMNELASISENGVLKILPDADYRKIFGRSFYDKTKTRIFPLKNIDAKLLGSYLQQVKSGIGKIIVDERTNTIVVVDEPETIKEVQYIVDSLDLPVAQKIICLKYLKAPMAYEAVKDKKSALGKITVDERSNTIILSDTAANVDTMVEIISKLDIEMPTGIFELKFTDASTLKEKIKDDISKDGSCQIDVKTNKIILTDYAGNLDKIGKIISEYDKAPRTVVKTYPLNYAKQEEISQKISEILTKDIGKVIPDERTNKITVIDYPSKVEEIDNIISELDEKTRQVLIEARVVQVRLRDDYSLGIDWEVLLNKVHDFQITVPFPPVSVTGSAVTGGSIGIGTIPGDDYSLIMEALQTVGEANLLSSPRILSVDGAESKIAVATRQAYVTTQTTVPDTGPPVESETVNWIDVGVILTVKPKINPDGYIRMNIQPEVSAVTDTLQTAKGNTVPIVSEQKIESEVLIKDGTTIIIGGLIEDQLRDSDSKVPILGDVPLFGQLFRRNSQEISKNELVIFLTPHIVSGDKSIIEFENNEVEEEFVGANVKKSKDMEIKRARFKAFFPDKNRLEKTD